MKLDTPPKNTPKPFNKFWLMTLDEYSWHFDLVYFEYDIAYYSTAVVKKSWKPDHFVPDTSVIY